MLAYLSICHICCTNWWVNEGHACPVLFPAISSLRHFDRRQLWTKNTEEAAKLLRHTHRYIYSEGQNGIRDKALVHLIGIRFGIKLDMLKTLHHLPHKPQPQGLLHTLQLLYFADDVGSRRNPYISRIRFCGELTIKERLHYYKTLFRYSGPCTCSNFLNLCGSLYMKNRFKKYE